MCIGVEMLKKNLSVYEKKSLYMGKINQSIYIWKKNLCVYIVDLMGMVFDSLIN